MIASFVTNIFNIIQFIYLIYNHIKKMDNVSGGSRGEARPFILFFSTKPRLVGPRSQDSSFHEEKQVERSRAPPPPVWTCH